MLDRQIAMPFFSIGVTTFDRIDLLRETLLSILGQTFANFEILVSNDNPNRILTEEMLGIRDKRIKIINQKDNLGEIGNMNYLLENSSGRYFTWLADDDVYSPIFLESVYISLNKHGLRVPVFTSYLFDGEFKDKDKMIINTGCVISGAQFLQGYLARQINTQGCYGVYEKEYLIKEGGIKKLGSGFSPYSDNLLAIKCGLLENVVYIDKPLILFRTHSQSISLNNVDVNAYQSAHEELCLNSLEIFRNSKISENLDSNLYLLLKWCFCDYCSVLIRSKKIQFGSMLAYCKFMIGQIRILRSRRVLMSMTIIKYSLNMLLQIIKNNIIEAGAASNER